MMRAGFIIFVILVDCFEVIALTCPEWDEQEEPTTCESFQSWLCGYNDWTESVKKWKEHIEEVCSAKDLGEEWEELFSCPDLNTAVECVNASAQHCEKSPLNCTICYCQDGKYKKRQNYFSMWRSSQRKFQKAVRLYDEKLDRCGGESIVCSDTESAKTTEVLETDRDNTTANATSAEIHFTAVTARALMTVETTPEKDTDVDSESLNIATNPNKTINWWVTVDPGDGLNLRHALMSITSGPEATSYPLMASLKSIYTCCNAFNISRTDEDTPRTLITTRYSDSFFGEVIKFYRREMAPAKIFTHVTAQYDAMMTHGSATTNKTATIAALVSMAKDAGLDGLVFDYEPTENYTREHAEVYKIFLDELFDAMEASNMTLGTVISDWGILKYYDIYASCKVEFMGSMGSTYYGHNIEKNRQNVLDMVNSIEHERLEIGLGLMISRDVIRMPKENYRWTEENLRDFLAWTKEQGVTRFHVYPEHWRAHRAAETFFLQALADV